MQFHRVTRWDTEGLFPFSCLPSVGAGDETGTVGEIGPPPFFLSLFPYSFVKSQINHCRTASELIGDSDNKLLFFFFSFFFLLLFPVFVWEL